MCLCVVGYSLHWITYSYLYSIVELAGGQHFIAKKVDPALSLRSPWGLDPGCTHLHLLAPGQILLLHISRLDFMLPSASFQLPSYAYFVAFLVFMRPRQFIRDFFLATYNTLVHSITDDWLLRCLVAELFFVCSLDAIKNFDVNIRALYI